MCALSLVYLTTQRNSHTLDNTIPPPAAPNSAKFAKGSSFPSYSPDIWPQRTPLPLLFTPYLLTSPVCGQDTRIGEAGTEGRSGVEEARD